MAEPETLAPEVDEEGDANVETESYVEVSAGTSYPTGETDPETGKEVKGKVEATLQFRQGADLTEAVELYGEDVVYERYSRGVTKDCGNAIRSALNKHLENGADVDEIPDIVEAELKDWRPDVTRRRVAKSVEEDITAKFGTLDPDKKAEIMAMLREQMENE